MSDTRLRDYNDAQTELHEARADKFQQQEGLVLMFWARIEGRKPWSWASLPGYGTPDNRVAEICKRGESSWYRAATTERRVR